MSFPKSALLSDFGWEPINASLDRQRVNYFARFDELPAHRLCKIVFMELNNSEFRILIVIYAIDDMIVFLHYFLFECKTL
jgi:hypothetical protein